MIGPSETRVGERTIRRTTFLPAASGGSKRTPGQRRPGALYVHDKRINTVMSIVAAIELIRWIFG